MRGLALLLLCGWAAALGGEAQRQWALGQRLVEERDLAGATAALERVVELEPAFSRAHADVGALYASQGRTDDSVAALQRSLALDPSHNVTRQNLRRQLLQISRTDLPRGAAMARAAMALLPEPERAELLSALLGILPDWAGWHMRMVADEARLSALAVAACSSQPRAVLVVEIGSAAAERVAAACPGVAVRSVAPLPGLGEGPGLKAFLGSPPPTPTPTPTFDVVVVDVIGSALYMPGLAPLLVQLAQGPLTAPDVVFVPHRADFKGLVIESGDMDRLSRVDTSQGVDLRVLNPPYATDMQLSVPLCAHEFRPLSDAFPIASMFPGAPFREVGGTLPVALSRSGAVAGVAVWFELFMAPTDTAPAVTGGPEACSAASRYWPEIVHIPSTLHDAARAGQQLQLQVSVDRQSLLRVDIPGSVSRAPLAHLWPAALDSPEQLPPSWHAAMLRDEDRNEAYAMALRRVVTPRSLVLDAGAGGGFLTVLAAKLGAEAVIGVEFVPSSHALCEAMIAANNVSSRAQVLLGDVRHVQLPRLADVLVSETFGSAFLDEGFFPLLAYAREHLLAPGATVVPAAVTVRAMVVDCGEPQWPSGLLYPPGGPAREVCPAWRPLSHPVAFPAVDLASFELHVAHRLAADVVLRSSGRADAVVFWFDVSMVADGSIRMATGPGSGNAHKFHWTQLAAQRLPLPGQDADWTAMDPAHRGAVVAANMEGSLAMSFSSSSSTWLFSLNV